MMKCEWIKSKYKHHNLISNDERSKTGKDYKEAMVEFTGRIKTECLNANIDYNLIETSFPYDKALLNYIQKRSKLF